MTAQRDVAVHEAAARQEAESLGRSSTSPTTPSNTAASIRPRIDPSA